MTKTKKSGVRGMIPTNMKTDDGLLQRLQESAKRTLTKEEVRAQRVSFVYGNMPQDSSISRKEIVDIIRHTEGEAA